jgi:hypothetical protein
MHWKAVDSLLPLVLQVPPMNELLSASLGSSETPEPASTSNAASEVGGPREAEGLVHPSGALLTIYPDALLIMVQAAHERVGRDEGAPPF